MPLIVNRNRFAAFLLSGNDAWKCGVTTRAQFTARGPRLMIHDLVHATAAQGWRPLQARSEIRTQTRRRTNGRERRGGF
jgi:hypothetical protein